MKIKEIIQVYRYIIAGGFLVHWNLEWEKRFWFSFSEAFSDKVIPSIEGINYVVVGVCENNIGQDEPVFIYIDNTDETLTPDSKHHSLFHHIYLSRKYIKEINK